MKVSNHIAGLRHEHVSCNPDDVPLILYEPRGITAIAHTP